MAGPYYETALTFTSQFYFCGLPLRLDSYSYCPFGCRYCFAKRRGGNFNQPRLKVASARALERLLHAAAHECKSTESILVELLRRRVPIHFGGMTDPFPVFEEDLRISFHLLEVLDAYNYPVVISTKSALVACQPYVGLLSRMKYRVVQFSISGRSSDYARRTERNTPTPAERLRAMTTLSALGIPAFCRLQPLFPSRLDDALALIRELPSAGCRHVAVEHLKLPLETTGQRDLISSLSPEVSRYYQDAQRVGREWVLPAEMKERNLRPVAKAIREHGMTFGAADNDLQHFSDTMCCCSGVDQLAGFENFFRHHLGYGIRAARGCEAICYSEIAHQWSPRLSPNRFLNSKVRRESRDGQPASVSDYIREKWNSPGTQNSPTSWWGVRATGQRDVSGNKIYAWG